MFRSTLLANRVPAPDRSIPGAAPHKADSFHGTNLVKITLKVTVKPVVIKRPFFAQRIMENNAVCLIKYPLKWVL